MLEPIFSSSPVMISLAVVAGIILGGACIEALRRGWPAFPRAPLMGIVAYGGGMMLGGTLLGGCIFLFGGGAQPFIGPPTSTRTPTAGIITFTPSMTPLPRTSTDQPPITRTVTSTVPSLTRTPDITLTDQPTVTRTVTSTVPSLTQTAEVTLTVQPVVTRTVTSTVPSLTRTPDAPRRTDQPTSTPSATPASLPSLTPTREVRPTATATRGR